MDLSQVSVRTKIYIDIEVRQIAQKWKLEIVEVTESTTIARTVVREAITLEERQGEFIVALYAPALGKNEHRGPPGNFTSDFHLWSASLRSAAALARSKPTERPGGMTYPLTRPVMASEYEGCEICQSVIKIEILTLVILSLANLTAVTLCGILNVCFETNVFSRVP